MHYKKGLEIKMDEIGIGTYRRNNSETREWNFYKKISNSSDIVGGDPGDVVIWSVIEQGRIHGKTIVDGWAAAVMQKPHTIQKYLWRTDWRTDRQLRS